MKQNKIIVLVYITCNFNIQVYTRVCQNYNSITQKQWLVCVGQ